MSAVLKTDDEFPTIRAPESWKLVRSELVSISVRQVEILHTPEKSIFLENNAAKANMILYGVLKDLATRDATIITDEIIL